MTDVIGAISNAVTQWNTESKCGFCWEFTNPMRESDLNEYVIKGENCCVVVAVTDYRFSCTAPMNRTTGLIQLGSETFAFNLHVLKPSNVGLNVYNEQSNHDIEESKWGTILKPLADCLACNPISFCEYLGYELETVRWDASQRIDWLDNNYDGWSISVQLRKNNVG